MVHDYSKFPCFGKVSLHGSDVTNYLGIEDTLLAAYLLQDVHLARALDERNGQFAKSPR